MAAYLVLGNVTPAAAGTSTLVTGSANGSIVSSWTACNKGGSTDAIRVAITKSGGSAYYQYYGFNIPANSTLERQPGITLASGDTITVYSSTGNTDFIATGSTL
jgi:hypothetical protein